MRLHRIVERLERTEALDDVARSATKAVGRAVPHGLAKDVLSGTWLGHPLHPLLTDIPIGAWTGAFALDVLGGAASAGAANKLIGLGVLASVPTAISGLSDWSDFVGAERRVGLVHAVANVTAIACYASSYVARRRGARHAGRLLAGAGLACVTAGGYLGGHLSYGQGANVNRNAWDDDVYDWTVVAREADLADGQPLVVDAEGIAILLRRSGTRITAIAERCGHAGGPLHEGTFDGDCVTCPWHQSTFRLDDGAPVHGPATSPQPAYEARLEDSKVLIRSLR